MTAATPPTPPAMNERSWANFFSSVGRGAGAASVDIVVVVCVWEEVDAASERVRMW